MAKHLNLVSVLIDYLQFDGFPKLLIKNVQLLSSRGGFLRACTLNWNVVGGKIILIIMSRNDLISANMYSHSYANLAYTKSPPLFDVVLQFPWDSRHHEKAKSFWLVKLKKTNDSRLFAFSSAFRLSFAATWLPCRKKSSWLMEIKWGVWGGVK